MFIAGWLDVLGSWAVLFFRKWRGILLFATASFGYDVVGLDLDLKPAGRRDGMRIVYLL